MNRSKTKLLLILFGNPGGDGKSTIAAALEALSRALGLSVDVVCADAGNGAIRQMLPSAASVVWGAPPQIGASIVAAYEKSDVAIIDCGANSSTAAFNILDLLVEARAEAVDQGRECLALLPIGTNKPGAAGMAQASHSAFLQAGFQACIVLNNRDGSGEYLGVDSADLPMPEVPHLAPGFVSVLNQHPGSWYQLLSSPAQEYALALDFIADWLQRISALEPIRRAFNLESGGLHFGRYPPLKLRRVVSRLEHATDKAVEANHEYAKAFETLLAYDVTSPALPEAVMLFKLAVRG